MSSIRKPKASSKLAPAMGNPSIEALPSSDPSGQLVALTETSLGVADDIPEMFPRFFIQRKKKNANFHKPNPLVHNKPQAVMTVMQQKLTNILLRHAQQNSPIGDATWKISVSEMLSLMDVDTRNTKHLEKTIEEMMSIKVRLDIFEEYGIAKHFAVVFPYAKLYSGEITFKIEREAIKLLGSNNSYTNLDLSELSKLSKVCSVPLYEFGSRYLGIGASRWLDWEDLRDMLVAAKEIPKKAMQWASFNERYLTPSVKDINSSTKLHIEIETERLRTKVTKVRVVVSKQVSVLETSAANANSTQKSLFFSALESFGMPEKGILKTITAYSKEEIEGAIQHTKWRVFESQLRKLKYPHRFFLASLKAGYYRDYLKAGVFQGTGELFPVATDSAEKINQNRNGLLEAASSKNDGLDVGRSKINSAVQKQRLLDVKNILAEMSDSQLLQIYADYNATLLSPMLHIKKGRNRAGVLPSFHAWYAKQLWGEVTDAEIVKTLERILSSK